MMGICGDDVNGGDATVGVEVYGLDDGLGEHGNID